MYYIYVLVSDKTDWFYIGLTSNLNRRLASHRFAARSGKKSKLYAAMRKHGPDTFRIVELSVFTSLVECQKAEMDYIRLAREGNMKILNLADGGQTGYKVPECNRSEWVSKLKAARKGKQPFLGKRHTANTKELCAKASEDYWKDHRKFDDLDPLSLSFSEAHKKFGISKTHFYRLLKRAKSNALS